eukprot:1326699-Alexandrium_andersonii.AAC.1
MQYREKLAVIVNAFGGTEVGRSSRGFPRGFAGKRENARPIARGIKKREMRCTSPGRFAARPPA